ncbi:hypothetical protein BKK79_36770 (plasmid) [Cupriavidus sp. USMAA2-4]|uniref:CAP domain-containing protein n=1 Tax=Cupriavidus sp. USMAA2-4 TaxID=876364 RepID=UPI0008A70CE6|nr:CAP domain-containing protein [Cupriavidus sp. USMAA2-4]AOY97504.1 hypothetical protein BKK79_36770 [Cupriavidus sp. USMAA2-4]
MKKTIFVLAALAALSGCGGGGDGGSSASTSTPQPTPTAPVTQPTTPAAPASVAPATGVGAPTYATTDIRYSLFNLVNTYRNQMGVGELRQDALLDAAAQAHANYLSLNGVVGGHVEVASNPGFTGAYPRDRATVAGVPASTWVGETISGTGSAQACLTVLANSVYHLQSLTANQESVGIGYNVNCVMDFGTVTGYTGQTVSQLNAIPVGGGQQMAATAIAYSPLDGETVDKAMAPESPQPAPDIAAPGHPVMVRVRADLTTDVLSVSTFKLVDSSGADVAGRILIAPNAKAASNSGAVTDSGINAGVAFFLPQVPLGSNKTYTAVFSGARNGVAISKSWSFKTYF